MYISIHVYVYIYTYMHIQTCIYIYIPTPSRIHIHPPRHAPAHMSASKIARERKHVKYIHQSYTFSTRTCTHIHVPRKKPEFLPHYHSVLHRPTRMASAHPPLCARLQTIANSPHTQSSMQESIQLLPETSGVKVCVT